MLISLLLIPALGGVLLATSGEGRDASARWLSLLAGATTLVLSCTLVVRQEPPATLLAWMPSLGVSFILESDGLSSILVVWMALSTLITLASTWTDARTAALVLSVQAGVNGLVLARDVFLVFAFLGALAVALTLLAAGSRKVLIFQLAGLTLLYGWFAQLYRMAYTQTGFPSTELERWQTLALYPDEERALFALAAVGVATLLPSFAIALERASRVGRLTLVASFGVVVTYLLLRIVVPLSARGAGSASAWALAFAVVMVGYAALGRGWSRASLGFQGLVVLGLFAFVESSVVGAILLMLSACAGLYGLVLVGSHRAAWFFALFLAGMPIACVLVPVWRVAPAWALVATGLFAVLAFRLVSSVRAREDREPEPRSHALFAVPVILWSLSLVLGWGTWIACATPAAKNFLEPPAGREGQP